MKKILGYWALTLILYGIFLALGYNYETFSILYHFALLAFPLSLVFSKKETFESLGFRKGDTKQGITWLFFILILLLGGIYLRAFLVHKSVNLVFDYSLLFISTITLGPLSEEIYHRGLLQTKFERKIGEKGIFLASGFFALIHVPKLLFAKKYVSFSTPLPFVSNPITTLVSLFLLGMIFGYIYRETKSINYAIAAHIFVNLILGIFIY